MAVRFDASGDSLSRTTNLPTISAFTLMGWFYLSADRDANANLLAFGDSAGGGYVQAYVNQAGASNALSLFDGAGTATGSTLSNTTWYHVALTCSGFSGGTERDVYLNGVLDCQLTGLSASAASAEKIWVGNDNDTEFLNGRAAAVKIYDAVLTASQIVQEMRQILPASTVSLNAFYPLWGSGDVTDYSANGRSWTVGGTLATEDGPPVPWKMGRRRQVYIPAVGGNTAAVWLLGV